MTFALAYFTALAACVLLDMHTGIRRPLLVVALPLYTLDCAANCILCRQSWRNSMSGEAWHHREDRWWGWCYRFINWMFRWQRRDHCWHQAMKEAAYGGFWQAYAAEWKQGRML